MKSICIIALALVASCAADGYKSDEGKDVAAILKNIDEVKGILDCFNGQGECSSFAAGLRDDLPDALATACAKCTQQQKLNTYNFFAIVKDKFPGDYKGLQEKFDPENKLMPAFLKAITP